MRCARPIGTPTPAAELSVERFQVGEKHLNLGQFSFDLTGDKPIQPSGCLTFSEAWYA